MIAKTLFVLASAVSALAASVPSSPPAQASKSPAYSLWQQQVSSGVDSQVWVLAPNQSLSSTSLPTIRLEIESTKSAQATDDEMSFVLKVKKIRADPQAQIANTRNLDGAASWPGVDDNAKLVLSSDEIESRVKSLESTNTALSRRQSGNPNRDGIVGIGHEIGAFVGPPIGIVIGSAIGYGIGSFIGPPIGEYIAGSIAAANGD